MKVSVIIPNFNHSAFLQQRIDSVLNQTYQDFEIIILDDCSTDNSHEVIETYRDHPKVTHIIYNKINSASVFKQWEKGIQLSGGEYIWIAESDDYAALNFLSTLVPVLESDKRISLVYSDSFCHTIDDKGTIDTILYSSLRNKSMATNKWSGSYINNGQSEIKESLINRCTINNASAVLFRKQVLLRAAPFDLSFKYFGDWYCYLKMCMHGDLAYIHEPLNHYRDHANNASKNLMRQFSFIEEYFKIYDWAIKNVTFVEKSLIVKFFKYSTSHSLLKGWNWSRLKLYSRLLWINPYLFRKLFENHTHYFSSYILRRSTLQKARSKYM